MPGTDPDRDFAVDVVRRLKAAGYAALWAGGCVRDFLLGRDPQDYDVATNATPDEVRSVFGRRRTLAVGASFGVIIVQAPRGVASVEVATFRTEGPYLDGRRPESVIFSTPEADAQRRDFTINGMFYDPLEQQVLDFVGGEHDLSLGVIRAIGEPHARMREDKLRLLRAVRFAANLDFQLDPATAAAVQDMAPEIAVVSAERITQEMRKILVHPHRKRGMQLCRDLGLLTVILPELHAPASAAQWETTLHILQLLPDPSFGLALAALLHPLAENSGATESLAGDTLPVHETDVVQEICRRWRLSNEETSQVCWLLAHQSALEPARDLSLAALKRLMAQPHVTALLSLVRAQTIAHERDLSSVLFCEEFCRQTTREEINPPQLISGADLISAGLQPGPRFRQLLEAIRDAQLNDEISTRDEALQRLQQLAAGD